MPNCRRLGSLTEFDLELKLTWELKVLIDIAFNFGVLQCMAKMPNYSNYDYYEELVKMANKFLNTPAPVDSLYVEEIDKFAEGELLKLFGEKTT